MVIRCARVLMLTVFLLGSFFSGTIMVNASPETPRGGSASMLQDDPLLPDDLMPD